MESTTYNVSAEGQRRSARQFRRGAWETLRGKYWWAVLVTMVAAVLGAGGVAAASFTFNFRFEDGDRVVESIRNVLPPATMTVLLAVLIGLGVVCSIIGIAQFVLSGAVQIGLCRCNLDQYDGKAMTFPRLFSGFSIFGKALWLVVLTALKTLAWTLLFIVPGIVAAYSYALAPYLLAEHPDWSAHQAVEESKRLMCGNKGRMFRLDLSFLGWVLLAGLTCGAGSVFLAPYPEAAHALFYLEVSGQTERICRVPVE